jgi:hypothetical protein
MAEDASVFGAMQEEHITVKRRKLRSYDLLPSQALNSMGASSVETMSLKEQHDTVKKGNKAVDFFSEWGDEDTNRKGIAVSRLAEVMLQLHTRMHDKATEQVIKPDILSKANKELDELKG